MASAAIASLDFLLRHPNALLAKSDTPKPCDRLYVPLTYVRHLSGLTRDENGQYEQRQSLLNNFAHVIGQLNGDFDQPFFGANGLAVCFYKTDDYDDPDEQALTAAKDLSTNYPNIPLITSSPALKARAAIAGIPTVTPVLPLLYSGRRSVHLDDAAIERLVETGYRPVARTTWQQQIDPSAPALRPYEFIEITNPPPVEYFTNADGSIPQPSPDPSSESAPKPIPFPALRRFDTVANRIVPLRYQTFSHPKSAEIKPRTVGQHFLLDALLAPADETPIVIVQGEFGTGKTFLSIAAGYDGVLTRRYDSIVVCPRDSRLGDDIGALPGDTAEKTRSKALGFTDNLAQVIKITEKIPVTPKAPSTLKGKMEEFIREHVEFVPLVEMGGRSLTERFIIYDEVQDMTPGQARALVTRLGNRSKMIIMGDLSQINNPRLSRSNNGLSYLIERLAGKAPGVAYIHLESDEIIRHPLLCEIASFL